MKSLTSYLRIIKRMKMPALACLGFLIITKLIVGSVFLYRAGLTSIIQQPVAIASEIKKGPVNGEDEKTAEAAKDNLDMNFLLLKKAELDEKDKRLAKKETELKAIQEDINNKISKLTQLRDEIRSEMERKATMEDQKYKHLIKVFSTMKPQNAAGLIEKLDKQLAIELLSKMKGDDVGQILSYVDIDKAAQISEGLVKKDVE